MRVALLLIMLAGACVAQVDPVSPFSAPVLGGSHVLIAQAGQGGTVNGVTTAAIDTTGANLIVVSVGWYPTTTPDGTLTDSAANTWTLLTKQTVAATLSTRLFYCFNPTTSATHTFSYNGLSTYPGLQVGAWSGASLSPFDVENGAASASASTLATGSVTPSQNNTLIIAGLAHDDNSSGAVSISSGFTIMVAIPYSALAHEGGGMAYKFVAAGANNPTWDITTTSPIAGTIAVFK